MIRVVIADDQALVRGGFRSILSGQEDIEVVAEAADGAEAVDAAVSLRPDVMLMDIRMPNVDGIEATRRILAGGSRVRVLMLTTFDDEEYVYRSLQAGASGFLLKSAPPRELADAIRAVATGDALLSPQITQRLIADYLASPPPAAASAAVTSLTAREREVLRRIAAGRSNAEIATDLFLSELTVKSHVARLLAKLGLRDRVQAVVYAYENGLVRPGRA